MRADEKSTFLNMIDKYIEHIKETNNKSILARIYGIFSIKTKLFSPVDIIIMQNTSKQFDKKGLKYKFDLKGSLFNRYSFYHLGRMNTYLEKLNIQRADPFKYKDRVHLASRKDRAKGLPLYNGVLKDINFIELNNCHQHYKLNLLNLNPLDNEYLLGILEKDSQFLKENGLLDYSLYLVIELAPTAIDRNKDYGRNILLSNDCDEVYHIALIDYL